MEHPCWDAPSQTTFPQVGAGTTDSVTGTQGFVAGLFRAVAGGIGPRGSWSQHVRCAVRQNGSRAQLHALRHGLAVEEEPLEALRPTLHEAPESDLQRAHGQSCQRADGFADAGAASTVTKPSGSEYGLRRQDNRRRVVVDLLLPLVVFGRLVCGGQRGFVRCYEEVYRRNGEEVPAARRTCRPRPAASPVLPPPWGRGPFCQECAEHPEIRRQSCLPSWRSPDAPPPRAERAQVRW